MTINHAVLVTGGTGNIGSAIVSELLHHHYDVTILCRSEESANRATKLGAKVLLGSINESKTWLGELDQYESLIHTACSFSEDMGQIDMAFMHVLAHQSKQRLAPLKLIYTAGCWTYGSHKNIITETTQKQSTIDFQWMLESIDYLSSQTTIDLRVVSPTNVVNKEEHNVPPILLWELERCGQPVIPSDETLTWSLVERENLAELYRLVLEKGQRGEEYIGSAESTASVISLAKKLSSQPIKAQAYNEWLASYGSWTEGYTLQQEFSSQKAIKELGWQPKALLTST